MTTYKQMPAVIINLHEKGYTEDFEVKDGSFFWIQEQLSLPQQEFYIVETYHIQKGGKQQELHAVVWRLAGLLKYVDSLELYFVEPEKVEANLVKIKLLELMFYLSANDNKIMQQVLDLRDHFRSNITATVEENITNSLSLHQLAVLSGRSLSSFRRDFLAIYNMPPSQWIRQKRLEKAKELLISTTMTVTDVCYTTGFENIAHFSRLFKSEFGDCPSEFRMKLNIMVD